jgi:hypothetical protein
MDRRLILATAILAAASGCTRAAFVPDGPLARPLTEFERVDVRPLLNKMPAGAGSAEPPAASPNLFLQSFRKEMTSRLQRSKVLNLTNGPMVILEGTLLRYTCERRPPSYAKDNLTDKGTIEVTIVLTDEAGKRLGGGKAAVEYAGSTPDAAMKGAEKRIVAAIAGYLRKSVRGKEPEAPDPDDPP